MQGARDRDEPEVVVSAAAGRVETDWRYHTYKAALAAVVALLITATVVYKFAESWSWIDSFYFSAVTVTTVGFGDLAPTTDFTKLFTVFYVFAGISLIGVVLNERLRRHAIRVRGRRTHQTEPGS